jgi:hypothetical protein
MCIGQVEESVKVKKRNENSFYDRRKKNFQRDLFFESVFYMKESANTTAVCCVFVRGFE